MSDNNVKLKAGQSVAEATESVESIETIEEIEPIETEKVSDDALKQAAAEFIEKTEKTPANGGAERILELYQKVLSSNLPDEDKENLTLNLLSEWGKILEDISEMALEKQLSEAKQPELSIGYILSQIEKIRQENEYIYKALETLSEIVSGQGPADVAGEGKAKGVAETVKCREATNQKLIAFYEKLYDDIKPEPVDFNHFSLEQIVNAIERCDAGVMSGETSKALKSALLERLKA